MKEFIVSLKKIKDKDFITYFSENKFEEIIRCKDCMAYKEDNMGYKRCVIDGTYHREDWFCAGGAK